MQNIIKMSSNPVQLNWITVQITNIIVLVTQHKFIALFLILKHPQFRSQLYTVKWQFTIVAYTIEVEYNGKLLPYSSRLQIVYNHNLDKWFYKLDKAG